eukprot:TRINITY_DN5643_c0_g1_i3.p1 TRINITY_DN5643_c0_g1~~TRINITY_DN5643_c0_g1_i3.p1  ORF type:complete len:577 (+),score=52.06 TRINITY_DN5643_c0_g1_i3:111-1841(+)
MGQEVPKETAEAIKVAQNEEMWGPRGMMNRIELIKLIQDAVERLGYPEVAQLLQRKSGVEMQPQYASSFRCKILSGEYDDALQRLPSFGANRETEAHVKFIVRQQQFLELLAKQLQEEALHILRHHMAGLGVRETQLQILASLFLNPMRDDGIYWERGSNPQTGRTKLLQELQYYLPPAKLIPPGRIEELIERALSAQVEQCLYSNDPCPKLTLLQDYSVGLEQLPLQKLQSLDEHSNEVWHVQFSEDGKYLASSCKDGAVRIYEVTYEAGRTCPYLKLVRTLVGHGQGHVNLALWESGGNRLLSVGSDDCIVVWNMEDGSMTCVHKAHSDVLLSCVWLANGNGFLSGGKDKQLIHYSVDGAVLSKRFINRVNDMVVNSSNTILITLIQECHIHFYRMIHRRSKQSTDGESEEGEGKLVFKQVGVRLEENQLVMSICLSRNDQYLLVTLRNHTMHLWSIGKLMSAIPDFPKTQTELHSLLPTSPVMHYHASERSTRFQFKGMFGGYQERFVILGGEDCKIYIWHRDSGKLLATLFDHSGPVNCISWNPSNPYLLASASDDKSVNIWGASILNTSQE